MKMTEQKSLSGKWAYVLYMSFSIEHGLSEQSVSHAQCGTHSEAWMLRSATTAIMMRQLQLNINYFRAFRFPPFWVHSGYFSVGGP